MRAYLRSLGLGSLLLWSGHAWAAQQHKLHIDDTGAVIKAHQEHHAKVGNTITWVRHTGAGKPWYVKFDESPCAEGSEFGSDRAKSCTVKVACHAAGDKGCKAYSYHSATGAGATLTDPTVIIDP
jgi:hypothetical protein